MIEKKRSRGRPKIGDKRSVNLTLTDGTWLKLECLSGLEEAAMSERLRFVIEEYFLLTSGRKEK